MKGFRKYSLPIINGEKSLLLEEERLNGHHWV
jgi:hypothetical protein